MSDKCNMCKCYVEDGNCPCHFVNDDELCDFSFELINIAEHDKQIRADAIEEFADYLRMSYDKGMRIMMAVAKTETEKFKIKAMYSQFISNIDDCVKFYKDMSELKP